MKRLKSIFLPGRIFYNDRMVRLASALFSAHFIIAFGEKESFFELLGLSYYYTALAINSCMAMVLIESIYYFTINMDKYFPWEDNIYKRTFIQLAGGVMLPLGADCLLAAFYYWCYGTDLLTAGHFTYNFPVITLFLLLFNAYYLIHYLIKLKLRRKPRHVTILSPAALKSEEFPVLIHTENRICFEITNLGNKNYLTASLEKIFSRLPPDRYFLINRANIIERGIIDRLIPGKSKTIRIILKGGIYQDVFVSQRNAAAFKEWYYDLQTA